jgi:hypothetical protein
MALTQVEPYVVDSSASFTVANITVGNVVATGNITLGNTVITSTNYSSLGRALYMGIVFGG